jgi:hypothetical protein
MFAQEDQLGCVDTYVIVTARPSQQRQQLLFKKCLFATEVHCGDKKQCPKRTI